MSFAAQSTSNHPVVEFRQVINLTPHHITLYDSIGNIAICNPGCHSDLIQALKEDTMVIVANDSDPLAFSIPEANTVRVLSCSIGRRVDETDYFISRLVRPLDGAVVVFSPPETHYNTDEVYYA